MNCPLLFFQTTDYWPAVIAAVGVLLTPVVIWYLSRHRPASEIRKAEVETTKAQSDTKRTDIETVLDVIKEFPDLLRQVREAHTKSIADERKISELEAENGVLRRSSSTCEELRINMLDLIDSAEIVFTQLKVENGLWMKLRLLRVQLEAVPAPLRKITDKD